MALKGHFDGPLQQLESFARHEGSRNVAGAKARPVFLAFCGMTEVMPFYKARFDGPLRLTSMALKGHFDGPLQQLESFARHEGSRNMAGAKARPFFVAFCGLTEVMPFYKARFNGPLRLTSMALKGHFDGPLQQLESFARHEGSRNMAGAKARPFFVAFCGMTEVMPFYKARFDGPLRQPEWFARHEGSNAVAVASAGHRWRPEARIV